MTDLVTIFEAAARSAGERTALIDAKGEITFAALRDRAEAFAARLAAAGIGKGDRVLVATPVGAELYISLAALWRLGAVAVFPEPAMGLGGLLHAIRTTRPTGFVAAGPYRWLRLLPQLWRLRFAAPTPSDRGEHPLTPLTVDDPALISFTSGSTGAPKAIERSHGFLIAQHEAVLPLLGTGTLPRDFVAFPVFVLINLALGRTSILPDWTPSRLDRVTGAALARLIARTGATRLLLPPALCERLAAHGTPPTVTAIFTGGGPVFPDIIDALRAGRPGLAVTCVYGSTEAEPIAHLAADQISDTDRRAMREGAGLLAGHPVPSVRLRIADDEIQVAGGHVNRSYLDPARNAETKIAEGDTVWHRTGDAGRLDASGRLWLLGRTGAISRAGGRVVYPFAIETAARFWPGVHRAALCETGERLVLGIEGEAAHLADWREAAQALGVAEVIHLDSLPLDRRHRSKIDYPALARLIARSG